MPSGPDQARDQQLANLSGLPYYDSFAEHRRQLTALALEAGTTRSLPTLCVLGAGNCFDLDLHALAEQFVAIHLVDIDASAIERAVERQGPATRARLVCHAPVDLTGFLDRIDRWSRFEVTPAELLGHPQQTATKIREQVSGPFDVVLSACTLSQMQLSVLNVLTDQHRLFEAVRLTLNLTHLRTLAELTRPAGAALLATDASSSKLYPLAAVPAGADCSVLLSELVTLGKVFDFADPRHLANQVKDDPALSNAFGEFQMRNAWIWSNGPHAQFLVYASALTRR
ncbi:MAG: hypothetical protein ABI488_07500 [Polyangiaceae bacterium]